MLLIYFFKMLAMLFSFGVCVRASGDYSLLNRHLKVAAVPWKPFIIFYCNEKEMDKPSDECPDNDNLRYGGILWELLDWVKLKRNVTFSISSPRDKSWGFCYGVNNCTGMIGMVNRREVDFALGTFRNHLVKMEYISRISS